jgi:hypothetical protein
MLQGLARGIHRRGARADHGHPLAAQALAVPGMTGVHPAPGRQLLRPVGHPGAAQAVTAGGQHHMAGVDPFGGAVRALGDGNPQAHPIGARRQAHEPPVVLDRQAQHLPVPAQVLAPDPPRDLAQGLPGLDAMARHEPRAKTQRGNAQARPGEFLG